MAFINKVRNELKKSFDNIRNEKLKLNLLQAIPYWIASLITGLLAVLYARLFAMAEHTTSYIVHHFFYALFIITPVCFLIARWLVKRYAPFSRGSGIPQVMVSLELATPHYNEKVNKLLSLRIIFIKVLSSLIMVIGGGVIGREGPTIQIAGSVFRKINQWLPEWWPKISKKNMIMTGAAAGLAAAFNTPLGGIVFAVEELTKTHISYFKTAIFTSVIIAGLTAQALMGPYLYLGYPNVNNVSPYMFSGVILIALITGLGGSAMSKLILILMRWKSKFKFSWQHISYIVICALIIVTCAYFIDERVFGSGKEIMTTTLFTQHKYLPWYIPVLRIAGPVFSFSTGSSGGIFAPALSAGASVGSFLSGLMHLSDSNTNLLILSGMVGFLTGVTRTPFTSAILVLEMTDRHNMIFYLMLAGLIASLAAIVIDKHSFYDHLKFQYMRQLEKEDQQIIAQPEAVNVIN
jgi:H+/Cl- antiporter ClcA